MKSIILTACTAGIILLSCNDNNKTETTSSTQDSTGKMDTVARMNNEPAPAPMDSASMMKAWMTYMTPGQVHAMLAKSNGTWDEEVTTWMNPGAPPIKSKATVVNKMILGGRYQESHHSGNFNGMPFEGLSTLGYDNAKKTFQSSWVDNMGTGVMYMEGKWDSTTKTIDFRGKTLEPTTGKDMDVRQTFTMTDDNNQKMEMYANQGGKEVKTMEIVLKRR